MSSIRDIRPLLIRYGGPGYERVGISVCEVGKMRLAVLLENREERINLVGLKNKIRFRIASS